MFALVCTEWPEPFTITSFPRGASASSFRAHGSGVDRSRSPASNSTGTGGSLVPGLTAGVGVVGGQYRHGRMIPLSTAVARSNGQTAFLVSPLRYFRSVASRPMMEAAAFPHGYSQSPQRALACSPWLRTSEVAPRSRRAMKAIIAFIGAVLQIGRAHV